MPRRRNNNSAVPGERVVDQRWDPGRYQETAGFVAVLGAPLLDLLAPKPGERILDLGCGDGALTEKIAAVADVVAVDASADQVKGARARGLNAHVMDGTRLAFAAEFDAVFSNAALHWVKNADAAADSIARTLRPGGRFVAEFGGSGNTRSILNALRAVLGSEADARCPWYYPSIGEYASVLERHGLQVRRAELFDRPTPLEGETGMEDWLLMFCGIFFAGLPTDQVTARMREVVRLLRPERYSDGVWSVDYRRLRVLAVKI